ncbi:hypothetical protein TWF281_011759 [Arthrobotrys megalospora]
MNTVPAQATFYQHQRPTMHVHAPMMYYQPPPLSYMPHNQPQAHMMPTLGPVHPGLGFDLYPPGPHSMPSQTPLTENHRRTRIKRRVWPPIRNDSGDNSRHSTPEGFGNPNDQTGHAPIDTGFW